MGNKIFKIEFADKDRLSVDELLLKNKKGLYSVYDSKGVLICWSEFTKDIRKFIDQRNLDYDNIIVQKEKNDDKFMLIHEEYQLIDEKGFLITVLESYIVDNERYNSLSHIRDVSILLKKTVKGFHFKDSERENILKTITILNKYKDYYKSKPMKFDRFMNLKEFLKYIVDKFNRRG